MLIDGKEHVYQFELLPKSCRVVRAVKGPTSSGPNTARTRKNKHRSDTNPKNDFKPKPNQKKLRAKSDLKKRKRLIASFFYWTLILKLLLLFRYSWRGPVVVPKTFV